MDPIQAAIEDIESREPGERFTYTEVAAKHNIDRTTLSRRHRGIQAAVGTQPPNGRKLSPPQESELILYIEKLTRQGLPPTREMIRNFASSIAKKEVSERWVSRFIGRNKNELISKRTSAMDRTRHQADSYIKYQAYFNLLHEKLDEYCLEAGDIYNMDEKGFLIGIVGTSKRVFSKRQWDKKEVRASLQDGSREFLTLLACICADRSSLPPSLIYASTQGAIRSNWVEGITAGDHDVFITSSQSGWSNNDVSLAWLEQVFDRCTKNKPGRWRLLILDSHGSHLTPEFLKYCNRHRILLMVFPPHSTHTLQPLDVVMFKPLSSSYSNELTQHLHNAQGLRAWSSSFKENTILKAFEATGIWPTNPRVILDRFRTTPNEDPSEPSRLSPSDWNQLQRLVRDAAKDGAQDGVRKLSVPLHHLQVQNELLRHENEQLRTALSYKKKHKSKGKALNLQQRQEYHSSAVFWSPRKFREAQAREAVRKQEEIEEKLQKARAKKQRKEARLQRQVELEERRVERQRLKVVREKEKAEKQAERERQKQQRNAEKAIQLSQRGKRKASQAVSSKEKRQKRVVDEIAAAQVQPAPSPPPTQVTSRGRNVKLPSKFR
ncbi:hypothetical protein HBI80_150040 [Parastagonospora nodorum]|nr:hypothetical protein HBI80_150040 [Parastagonospora nodorum]KAH4950498.1 hypothetical protein HBH74_018900 [Parastagonospora nodorum]KAH4955697.1 hypothetical protein HBH73_091260 [Parastagonospora nodorum]